MRRLYFAAGIVLGTEIGLVLPQTWWGGIAGFLLLYLCVRKLLAYALLGYDLAEQSTRLHAKMVQAQCQIDALITEAEVVNDRNDN